MTNFQQFQSEKILSSYFEKGRKPTPIGGKSKDGNFIKTERGWERISEDKRSTDNKGNLENKNNVYKTNYPVVDDILSVTEPFLNDLTEKARDYAKEYGIPFTERDFEYHKLNLIYDLLGALGKRIKKEDKLIKLNHSSHAGTVTINAIIERDGEKHRFNTRMILAGGYNIQKLHYRYITDSSLPSISNSLIDPIKEKLKKMKKEDKIKKDIKLYEGHIKRYENELEEFSKITKEEALKEWRDARKHYTWDSLSEDAKNRYGTSENFNNEKKEHEEREWERQLRKITDRQKSIKTFNKEIEKLNKKLENI